jgi:hypothetical protein
MAPTSLSRALMSAAAKSGIDLAVEPFDDLCGPCRRAR